MNNAIESLMIRSAVEIPRKWNALVAAIKALRPSPGNGILVMETPWGTTISAKSTASAQVTMPFRVVKQGDGFAVGFGVINNIEPKIGGEVISSGAVFSHRFDGQKREYIVLEIILDAKHQIDEGAGVQIAVTQEPKTSVDTKRGVAKIQHVLAMAQEVNGVFKLVQVAYFNLKLQAFSKQDGTMQYLIYAA